MHDHSLQNNLPFKSRRAILWEWGSGDVLQCDKTVQLSGLKTEEIGVCVHQRDQAKWDLHVHCDIESAKRYGSVDREL